MTSTLRRELKPDYDANSTVCVCIHIESICASCVELGWNKWRSYYIAWIYEQFIKSVHKIHYSCVCVCVPLSEPSKDWQREIAGEWKMAIAYEEQKNQQNECEREGKIIKRRTACIGMWLRQRKSEKLLDRQWNGISSALILECGIFFIWLHFIFISLSHLFIIIFFSCAEIKSRNISKINAR